MERKSLVIYRSMYFTISNDSGPIAAVWPSYYIHGSVLLSLEGTVQQHCSDNDLLLV